MAGGHGMYRIMGRNVGSQYVPSYGIQLTWQIVLGTWAIAAGSTYLYMNKKKKVELKDGPSIADKAVDPEEAKFIEYALHCACG
jgi:hypothetical protein